MPEPDVPVKDPERDSVSALDHSRPRSRLVDTAALAGGVLLGGGSAFVFFRLSLSSRVLGLSYFIAGYDALVGGFLGYCLGVRAVFGMAGAGSAMGSWFLPVVGGAYLGALARLVLVLFSPGALWFVTLILPFVGGLLGFQLSQGKEGTGASGASSEIDSPQPGTLPRLVVLSVFGLTGGVVGAVALGLVAARIAVASVRGMAEWGGLLYFMLGAVLGLPLGTATGLRAGGKRLGINGRFWSAVGASFAANLVACGLGMFLPNLMTRTYMGRAAGPFLPFLIYAAPFVLSLVGGLVGYIGWAEARRRAPAPLLHGLRLLLLCAAGLAGALLAGRLASLAAVSVFRGPGMGKLNLFALRMISDSDSYVGMLGYPIGVAAGMGLAGAWFRLRGRFWPALAGACAGLFAAFMLVQFSLDSGIRGTFQGLTMRRYIESILPLCLMLSLAGGLAAYFVSRRTRRTYPWWLVAGVLVLALTVPPTLSIIKGRTRLPVMTRTRPAKADFPAFLRYPGAVATTQPLMYGSGTYARYSFETADSMEAVLDFYRKALAGWQKSTPPGPQDGTAIFYVSRDGKQRVSGWVWKTGPSDSPMTSLSILYQRGGRGWIVPHHP